MKNGICVASALLLLSNLSGIGASESYAQPLDLVAVPAPAQPGAIALNADPHEPPAPESWFRDGKLDNVRNVSHATLMPFLPEKGRETGIGVIVAPGGGFTSLSYDREGTMVARWFASHGIAAFLLKYRLRPSPPDTEAYKTFLRAQIEAGNHGRLPLDVPPQTAEDFRTALRFVKMNVKKWNLDAQKIGIVGFSAGAIAAVDLVLHGAPNVRPDFVASIYGSMAPTAVPKGAPPLFIAYAADDPLFGRQGSGLADSWQQTGNAVELHKYERGGHGFGLGSDGTTTTEWPDAFLAWLKMHDILVVATNNGNG